MIVERKPLLATLRRLKPWTAKGSSIPSLSCVHLAAVNGRLELAATDLDAWAETAIDGQGETEWSVGVPVAALVKILPKLAGDEVTIRPTDGLGTGVAVSIRCDGQTIDIPATPAADLPRRPADSAFADGFEVAGFEEALRRVSFAVSREDSQLSAVLFDAEDGGGVLVATDRHRLAWHQTEQGPGDPVLVSHAILRAKLPVDEPIVFAPPLGAEWACRIGTVDGWSYTIRAVEGTFPDWRRVVDGERVPWFSTRREEMLGAIRRAAAIRTGRDLRTVVLSIGDGEVSLIATDKATGATSQEAVACATPSDGEGKRVALQADYLEDALVAADGEKVWVMGPADDKIAAVEVRGENSQSITMPCRV